MGWGWRWRLGGLVLTGPHKGKDGKKDRKVRELSNIGKG